VSSSDIARHQPTWRGVSARAVQLSGPDRHRHTSIRGVGYVGRLGAHEQAARLGYRSWRGSVLRRGSGERAAHVRNSLHALKFQAWEQRGRKDCPSFHQRGCAGPPLLQINQPASLAVNHRDATWLILAAALEPASMTHTRNRGRSLPGRCRSAWPGAIEAGVGGEWGPPIAHRNQGSIPLSIFTGPLNPQFLT
jgi:hypothetical protein